MTKWQLPGIVGIRVRAYGRAEESSGAQEGVVTYHVIAGRMRKSYLLFKVNLHVTLLVRYRSMMMIRTLMLEDLVKGRRSSEVHLHRDKKKRKILRYLVQSCLEK